MTNTRITDPEILENRYPIILNRFCLRDDNSGGNGKFIGGEGVHRELLFRKPVTLSVLTERRVLHPYGMAGGESAKNGLNLLRRRDGRIINLGGKTAINANCGDLFSMRTPGGGGYGLPNETSVDGDGTTDCDPANVDNIQLFHERGSIYEYRQAQESA